ncbi:MAG TPA: hypothetical protein VF507_09685, partial [Pyrinomonadaceae bacterium]
GEPFGAPEVYGDDRMFVCICVGETSEEANRKLIALEEAGHPVVRRVMNDPLDLGAEFFAWEFATAVAGYLLSINPFDQPNVQESKDNTNRLLDEFKSTGALPEPAAIAEDGGLRVYSTRHTSFETGPPAGSVTLASVVTDHLSRVGAGDYVALLAYIQETEEHDRLLQDIRARLRDRLKVATTTGYGPRFLHSTGQLHKGGAGNGVFIQLTDEDATDLPIPGEPYTFGVLKQAQALGDFSSLESHHRRAIRFHLGRDAEAGLTTLLNLIEGAGKAHA